MKARFLAFLIGVLLIISLGIKASALSVSAESAIVFEPSSGIVVFEKDADSRRPMASTTKIMTALIALESGDVDREVKVSSDAVGVEGSSVYLESGDTVTLLDLVWALMLESANDAAAAIAIEVAGSIEAFADLMNQKASELGLTNTHFTNPHGLFNEDHYTTARELAIIASHALNNPKFSEIVSTYRHSISIGDETRNLLNHNKMLKLYDGSIGVKTGYTKKSGRCLVSAAERDQVKLVAVTLDASDDWLDHRLMLDSGFDLLESRELAKPGEAKFSIPCIGSEKGEVSLSNHEGLSVCLPSDTGEVTCKVILPHHLWAPVESGDVVGKLIYEADGNILGELSIFADDTADRIEYSEGILDKIFG